MQRRKQTGPRRGFILITVLALTLGALTLSAVGLTRSMVEVSGASRYAATQQAFAQAEAGIDDTLAKLPTLTASQINALLCRSQPACMPKPTSPLLPATASTTHAGTVVPNYTVQVTDNVEADRDLTKDTDRIVQLHVTGTEATSGATAIVSATVQLPGSVFDYGLLASNLFLGGYPGTAWGSVTWPWRSYNGRNMTYAYTGHSVNWVISTTLSQGGVLNGALAKIGKDTDLSGPMNQVPLFLAGTLATGPGNQIWADSIKFTDAASCNQCNPADLSVFRSGTPVQEHQPFLSSTLTTLDLNPYYTEAIAECVAEGSTQAACVAGTGSQTHHITSNTVWTNRTVTGVVYVEKGVDLTLQGTTTVNGTIAHEGFDDATRNGYLEIRNTNPIVSTVTIDSTAGAHPFAPGLAVVGGAVVGTAGLYRIKGFMMMGGDYAGDEITSWFAGSRGYFADAPGIRSIPIIEGGLFATRNFSRQLPSGVNGPGVSGPINWGMPDDPSKGLHEIFVPGLLTLLYHQPPTMPPGFKSSLSKAKILAWQTQ